MEISQAQPSWQYQSESQSCVQALCEVYYVGAEGRYLAFSSAATHSWFLKGLREENNHLFIFIPQLQEVPKIWCFVSTCQKA